MMNIAADVPYLESDIRDNGFHVCVIPLETCHLEKIFVIPWEHRVLVVAPAGRRILVSGWIVCDGKYCPLAAGKPAKKAGDFWRKCGCKPSVVQRYTG